MVLQGFHKRKEVLAHSARVIIRLVMASPSTTTRRFVLRSGASMPAVGLGTWKVPPEMTEAAVASALNAGYRHLDCAPVYRNQAQVGAALTAAIKSGVCTREELFVTSKLMTYDLAPGEEERPTPPRANELNHASIDRACREEER